MFRIIFLIGTFFGGGALKADSFIFFGSGIRFDSESTGVSASRNYPLRLGGGYFLSPLYCLGLDLSRFSSSTNAGSVEISDEHFEILFWLRGSLWPRPSWLPFASVILGVQQDIVVTKFQSDSSTDRGRFEWVPGLGIGTYNQFWGNLSGGFEVRGLYRPWASPRYTGDLIATLGWYF